MAKSDSPHPSLDDRAPEPRRVNAHWDEEAKVWWAESEDIPGLVTEASTFDALVDNIVALVPDLLELNGGRDGGLPKAF